MYVKLFSSILTSSVWSEDMATRLVWITLLAMADKDGDVRSSPSGLARIANVPLESCHKALEKFLSPDTESGTQEHEGRRLEEREGGWFILNYAKYRALQDEETRKAQWRDASRRHRQRKSSKRHQESSSGHHESSHTEADTEADSSSSTAREELLQFVPNRRAWEAEFRAMEESMGGHHPATRQHIEQAAMEYVANSDFSTEKPNIRRFVHYVKVVQAPAFEPRVPATAKTVHDRLMEWAKEGDDA